MKIKSLNAMLGLKTIGTIEYFFAFTCLDLALTSDFGAVGWLLVSIILFVTGTNSFWTAHKDYKYFTRYKEDE